MEKVLAFLTALRENNHRDWMLAHKSDQQEATEEFLQLVQELLRRLAVDEPALAPLQAKELMFRLNRDTRFSHDKSPYLPVFRAHLSAYGKLPIPVGYYLHITPQHSFLGGGLFASQFADATQMIRQGLLHDGEAFLKIVEAPEFQQAFQLVGEKLKNVPKGYPKDLPQSEYFKYKSWALEYPLEDTLLLDRAKFCDLAVDCFRRMRPFHAYLNRHLAGFTMPKR